MASYIKAKQVEAVEEERDGIAGFRIIEKDSSHWQEASVFEAGHTLIVGEDNPIEDDKKKK